MASILVIAIGAILWYVFLSDSDENQSNDRPFAPPKRKAITNSKSPFPKDDPLFAEYQKSISQSINKYN